MLNIKLQKEFDRYYSLYEQRVGHLKQFSETFSPDISVVTLPDRFLDDEKFLDLDELREPEA